PGMMALGVALSMLVFFTFNTRMHERYMFASLLPLLLSCVYINRPMLWISFLMLEVIQFLAMWRAFFHLSFNAGDPDWLYFKGKPLFWLDWSPEWWHRAGFVAFMLSSVVVLITLSLVAYAFLLMNRVRVRRGISIQPVSDPAELLTGRELILPQGSDRLNL
ncbi:MAG: hypothetical protein ABI559_13515, partial [Chloroflexota bacterium]